MNGQNSILLLLLLGLFLTGCSATKHLEKDQYLLRKAKVHLKTDLDFSNKSIMVDDLASLRLQKPNTYLFGLLPYKVGLYNLRYKKYQKDTTNFQLTHRYAERPVIYDSLQTERTSERMARSLQNQGYFYASVSDSVRFRKKKAFVEYKVNTGSLYSISTVSYDLNDTSLNYLLPELKKHTLFRAGKIYSHNLASEERQRLTAAFQNLGYYRFSLDNIAFELDTLAYRFDQPMDNPYLDLINANIRKSFVSSKRRSLNIKILVQPSSDSLAFKRFRINRVFVFPDQIDSLQNAPYDSTYFNNISFKYHKHRVNLGILDKKIFIRSGDYYSQKDYVQTLRQLNDLGVFQYVRVYFAEEDVHGSDPLLNCFIIMTPNKRYNFQTNLEFSGGDLYIFGSAANVSITDNNFLKGANSLTTTFSYGLELNQDKSLDVPFFKQFYLFSRNIGFNFRLDFPKFITPFPLRKFDRHALPHTFVEAGVNSLRRIDYFSLYTITARFGYVWRASPYTTLSAIPIFVNTLHLSHIDPSFQEQMDSVPAIRNSYQETFIEGEEFKMEINTAGRKRNKYAYLKVALEESGALLSGIKGISSLAKSPLKFRAAHYFRLDFDGRQYFVGSNSSMIFRFAGGVGIPYDGSSVLPYLKQYFVGGAYSIRGWRPRVLGPGSYQALTNTTRDNLFIDQSGDIKLEWNAEYRFGMFKLFSGAVSLNGAFFADAGNIWLARKDDKLPGAEFRFSTLYQDIALSSGAGIRMDLGGFLVLRLDWAFPLKKPYVMDKHGWVLDEIDFGSRKWRRENLNFNLAIGYPF